ncbi:MAG: hypothetical protein RIQ60_3838, partial [Pseudomonadota bacterium]
MTPPAAVMTPPAGAPRKGRDLGQAKQKLLAFASL